NSDALAAFNRAANAWSSQITSAFPVNIVIDADMVNLGATNVIGQTSFTGGAALNQPYNLVRNAMAARAGRPGDAVLGSLPTQAQVAAHVPDGFVSNNQPISYSLDTQHIGILRANQKALGILSPSDPSYNSPDAIIQFNTLFNFDYRGNVVDPSKMDFQTVATHEIGHVLGFTSDVDDFDFSVSSAQSLSDDLTTLDMFRFNANELPTAANFATAARELRPGQASFTYDLTHKYAMSTGALNGDGHQASHWQDDEDFTGSGQLIGIMDPTLNFGTIETIHDSDLRAMELMGYDTVPEPGCLALVGFATIALLKRRRRVSVRAN
ncbi:MAG TPA: NF038122 family metalloprotease, partial [Humisphaera sp.]|nr:NF038122 family metalloprotease [Humisphaera sp.]